MMITDNHIIMVEHNIISIFQMTLDRKDLIVFQKFRFVTGIFPLAILLR